MSNAGFFENRHQKIWKKANRKLKTSSTILLEDKEGISEKKVEQDDNALKEGIIEKKVEQDVNEMKAFNFGLLDVTLNFGKNRRHNQEYHSISFSSANCVLLYLTKKKILIDAEKRSVFK